MHPSKALQELTFTADTQLSPHETSAMDLDSNLDSQTNTRHRILFVDDSRLMRVAAKKILNKEFDTLEAGDGEEAWNTLLVEKEIAVVLTDLSMPVLDGMGLLARIRNSDDQRIRSLPVVIVTGQEDEEKARESALSAGATDFISKPFDSIQLMARVKAQASHRDLQQNTAELEQASHVDKLTKLANQQYFLERGSQEVSFAKRHGNPFALLLISLDNFNDIYLKHGKTLGAKLIIQAARRMQRRIRHEDTLARIGVAHFALILPFTTSRGARGLAERLLESVIEQPFSIDGQTIAAVTSVGAVGVMPDQDTSFKALIQTVKQEMGKATRAGGNMVSGCEIPETATEIPPLAEALGLINANNGSEVEPHLPQLLKQIIPLLELADQRLGLELGETIGQLRNIA